MKRFIIHLTFAAKAIVASKYTTQFLQSWCVLRTQRNTYVLCIGFKKTCSSIILHLFFLLSSCSDIILGIEKISPTNLNRKRKIKIFFENVLILRNFTDKINLEQNVFGIYLHLFCRKVYWKGWFYGKSKRSRVFQ